MYGMAMNGQLLESAGWKPKTHTAIQIYLPMAQLKPVAYQGSPRKAFLELFGAAASPARELESKLALNGNLMDFLTDDARRVEKQLSGDDKERFALYMDSFNALRKIEEKKADSQKRCESTHPRYLTATTRQPQFEYSHTLRLLLLL